jgi:hypothetical protein
MVLHGILSNIITYMGQGNLSYINLNQREMNEFEKVIEGENLYLKVTTTDPEGNKSINYKICSSDQEFDTVVNNLVQNLKAKLHDINREVTRLQDALPSLEDELNKLEKLQNN